MRHAQDAPLAGADPVVWYSFGVTHVVRVEDFPIMPVEVGSTAVLHCTPQWVTLHARLRAGRAQRKRRLRV